MKNQTDQNIYEEPDISVIYEEPDRSGYLS